MYTKARCTLLARYYMMRTSIYHYFAPRLHEKLHEESMMLHSYTLSILDIVASPDRLIHAQDITHRAAKVRRESSFTSNRAVLRFLYRRTAEKTPQANMNQPGIPGTCGLIATFLRRQFVSYASLKSRLAYLSTTSGKGAAAGFSSPPKCIRILPSTLV
jgi:hypothetical protein